jgi:hypothetical protein
MVSCVCITVLSALVISSCYAQAISSVPIVVAPSGEWYVDPGIKRLYIADGIIGVALMGLGPRSIWALVSPSKLSRAYLGST